MEAGQSLGYLQMNQTMLCKGHVSRQSGLFTIRITDQADGKGGGLDPSVVAMLRYICFGQIPSDSGGPTAPVVIHRVTKMEEDCVFIFTLQRHKELMPEILLCVPENKDWIWVSTRFGSFPVPTKERGLWQDAVQMFRQSRLRMKTRDDRTCAICLSSKCERRLPCGHGAMCQSCVSQMQTCPFCREGFWQHEVAADQSCQVFRDTRELQLNDIVHFEPTIARKHGHTHRGTLYITTPIQTKIYSNVVERLVHTSHVSNNVADLLFAEEHRNLVSIRACVGVGFRQGFVDYIRWVNFPGPYTLKLYSDHTNYGSLATNSKLTPAKKYSALVGAWEGLKALGERGYFHCDIKSANVFLQKGENDTVIGKIGDIDGSCLTYWENFDRFKHYGYPFDRESTYSGWSSNMIQNMRRREDGSQADQVMLDQGGGPRPVVSP